MKKLLFLLLLPYLSIAQRVYVTHNRAEADKLVYRAKYFTDAHLVVKRTYDVSLPEKFHWFFVTSKQAADPGWTIFYVSERYESDISVFITEREGLLGAYTPSRKSYEEFITVLKGRAYRKEQYERKKELQSW